ncbi:hypothetical protein EfmAA242_29560 [Enterococcus faecium]|nr:hypothetical protein EfmAA242_29560 [Enterococcus faecium]
MENLAVNITNLQVSFGNQLELSIDSLRVYQQDRIGIPESCCQNFIQYTDAVEPLLQNVEKYHKIYQQCRKIYPATKEICHDL